jgi:oligopeptidase B
MISELPVADRRPHRVTYHGKTIDDPYHWLRDAGYPEVTDRDILAYLEAENAHEIRLMHAYVSIHKSYLAHHS